MTAGPPETRWAPAGEGGSAGVDRRPLRIAFRMSRKKMQKKMNPEKRVLYEERRVAAIVTNEPATTLR